MRIAWISLLLLSAAAFAGCAGENGTVSLYVKDKPPGDWTKVEVTFTEVSIHQSGGNDTSGWKVLFSDSAGMTVDLLNASGTRAAFFGETGLAPGHYQQIRIKAIAAQGTNSAGEVIPIQVNEKELKVVKSFRVVEGKETQLIIDVDLDKALAEKNGQWEFKNKIGKVFAHVKEKTAKPAKGTIDEVDLKDDA
jgi:hypothetical protein